MEVPQLDLVVTAGVAVQALEPEQRVYAALELGEPKNGKQKKLLRRDKAVARHS